MATAAAVKKVSHYNLADMMQFQRDAIRKYETEHLGKVTDIRLGIDDNAEYFRGEAWARVSRSSKVMGLSLQWTESEAPTLCYAKDKQTALLPQGIRCMPTVAATILTDIRKEVSAGAAAQPLWKGKQLDRMPQRLSDFASGRIMGRDGSGFLVLQPVKQIAIVANIVMTKWGRGSFLVLNGHPVDGRYPALLISPKSSEAYIVGGMMVFDKVVGGSLKF